MRLYPCSELAVAPPGFLNTDWRSRFANSNASWLDSNPLWCGLVRRRSCPRHERAGIHSRRQAEKQAAAAATSMPGPTKRKQGSAARRGHSPMVRRSWARYASQQSREHGNPHGMAVRVPQFQFLIAWSGTKVSRRRTSSLLGECASGIARSTRPGDCWLVEPGRTEP